MTDIASAAAAQAFDRQAASYEALRRALIPPFDAFYGSAVEAAGLNGPPRSVLDLGAGTGLLSRKLAGAYPEAELTLLDGAPAMLAEARATLGDRARYVVADLGSPLPAGAYDVVVSALAIHHLDDDGKRALFRRVREASPLFVNAEQVAGPYEEWHRERALAAGATQEDWAAAEERMRHDRLATVEDQVAWLREAGFERAHCAFQDHCFAVLVGC